MIDIKEALDQIFTYKRDEDSLHVKMNQVQDKPTQFSDIRIERPDLGFKGVIPFLADFGRGTILAYYTAEKTISRENIAFDKLPIEYAGLSNCAFTHMGVLMNCLAYMCKEKVSKLRLVRTYNLETFDMTLKPMIAEKFLGEIKKHFKPAVIEQKVTGRRSKKHANIDRNQAAIFS